MPTECNAQKKQVKPLNLLLLGTTLTKRKRTAFSSNGIAIWRPPSQTQLPGPTDHGNRTPSPISTPRTSRGPHPHSHHLLPYPGPCTRQGRSHQIHHKTKEQQSYWPIRHEDGAHQREVLQGVPTVLTTHNMPRF
jgi:hypothetical protein